MNINKNNYEEYFLLYADNELSAYEKNMVELFVQQNSDLEEEFLMLQQSVIKPDRHITLEDKSFLQRKEDEFITPDNYSEKFILYNDNELNDEEKIALEKLIRKDQFLENEFTLFEKVKFQVEMSVVFPDKEILYKKENKGKVIPVKWWRAVAAAVLLALGLWSGITYIQKHKTEVISADSRHKKTGSSNKISVPSIPAMKEPRDLIIANKDNKQEVLPNSKQNLLSKNQNAEKPSVALSIKKNGLTKKSQEQKLINKPLQQGNASKFDNNDVAVEPQIKNNDIANKATGNLEPLSANVTAADEISADLIPADNYAQTTSYIDDTKEQEDDNHIFYNVTTEKFNKSKLGGFLKKVTRVIERKLPFSRKPSDNKSEVAAN